MGKLTPLGNRPQACKCGICAYRSTLDADDRATLTAWLEDENIAAPVISKHLAAQETPTYLGIDGILRWRRRETACRRG